MANVINATSTGNGGLVSTGDDSGILNIQTNETTAITVDASQNVGIGTSSPTNRLTVNGGSGSTPTIRLNGGTAADDNALISSKYNLVLGCNADGNIGSRAITFVNSTTEYARIDSSGNLLVGTTTNIAKVGVIFDGSANNGCVLRTSTNASGTGFLYFQQDTNTCGSVVRVGTTSAVTYSSTSDYRLKENITPMTGALSKVARLKPVTYKWKSGGESAEGFIAHELAEVCPDAVVGTKDELDKDGNPKYQSIDTSFLVATLTAAIQELKTINDTQAETINALTARIVALESK